MLERKVIFIKKFYIKGCISCKYSKQENEFVNMCIWNQENKYINLINHIEDNKFEANICEHWILDDNIGSK